MREGDEECEDEARRLEINLTTINSIKSSLFVKFTYQSCSRFETISPVHLIINTNLQVDT